jgi:hypothetical protein
MLFEDVTSRMGINFRHQDGSSGEKYYIETATGGVGWLDFDNDGDLDLYLVNGAATPGSRLKNIPRNALYENRGDRFVEVTEQAGVGDTSYGMGVCAADIDGDGLIDFMVTNHGPDRLYLNRGGGRFQEVGERAGVADPRWSTGCAFGDLDGDGDLDLYVSRYADFSFDRNPYCGDRARKLRAYCRPNAFHGQVDSLYINRGDGTFVDEGKDRGIDQGVDDRGFAVLLSDLDDDGDLDIYVANDGTLNRLYVNDGTGHFEDQALLSGAGLNSRGGAEAGMGVDVGDVDLDGALDVLVTNYSMEYNTLYRNLGDLVFDDVTTRFGLGETSYRYVGWGIQMFDADNDGDLDFAVANGHPVDNIEEIEPGLTYLEPNQLFENQAGKRFREVSSESGAAWRVARSSRGMAAGDMNNDGRIDLLIANARDIPSLLENRGVVGHWVGLRLHGAKPNTMAIGARVTIKYAAKIAVREVYSGGGFLSQRDLRLHFGLGKYAGAVRYTVRWPDGRLQEGQVAAPDRYVEIPYQPVDGVASAVPPQ